FHERETEVPRQVSVLKVDFVVRPRCEQNNAWVGASRRGQVEEHFPLLPEKAAHGLDVAGADTLQSGRGSRGRDEEIPDWHRSAPVGESRPGAGAVIRRTRLPARD